MLNFRDSSNVWITTDTHFNHDPKWPIPIWKMRGFSSVVEMNDTIIDNINLRVTSEGILIHLGDFCLNTPPSQFNELISRINCQNIYMLWGNHPNSQYKNIYKPLVQQLLGDAYDVESEVYPLRYRNLVFIGHYAEVAIGGQFCVLSHYPISVWNEMMHGSWHFCGHSHYGFEPSTAANLDGKILDVCVDGHDFKPWSMAEISEVMKKKQYSKVDRHH